MALLGNSMRQGMPCERIDYRIVSAKLGERPEHYVFNTCRLPDGTWKLAEMRHRIGSKPLITNKGLRTEANGDTEDPIAVQ